MIGSHLRHKGSYRPDVDGLRAIAVMTVIFFHAGFEWMTGGYVGVDVFFVISGYLITQKLINEKEKTGTISFKGFYTGRLRRLFPAMLVTIAVSMITSWFVLTPDAFRDFAVSAIAAITSLSNILFYLEAGYWDAASHTKPLLHTWSLSVEEQFYLVWPALLFGLYGLGRKYKFIALAVIGLVALVAAEWVVRSVDPTLAFYITVFRVTEFVIGGLCVAIDRYEFPKTVAFNLLREALCLGGIAAILLTSVLYNDQTPFPGLTAMIPCLGTAAVIVARKAPYSHHLLTNPAMVFTGLISYSLYLVHWPVLVFYQIENGAELSVIERSGLIVFTFILSYALFAFVETPFRRARKDDTGKPMVSPARIALSAVSAGYILSLLATTVIVFNGVPMRFSGEFGEIATVTEADVYTKRVQLVRETCGGQELACGEVEPGRKNAVVLGDSKGPDGFNIMLNAYPEVNFLMSATGGCPPIERDTGRSPSGRPCEDVNKERFDWLYSLENIDTVIISMRMAPGRTPALLEKIEELSGRGYRVIVLGAGPLYEENLHTLVVRHGTFSGLEEAVADYELTNQYDDAADIRSFVEERGGEYISLRNYFCPDGPCRLFTTDGEMLNVHDKLHLTYEAAAEFGTYLGEARPDLFEETDAAPGGRRRRANSPS